MLKLKQIQTQLAFAKLGAPSVTISNDESWDEGIGAIIKDSRFTFISDWIINEDLGFIIDENDAWYNMCGIFHKYIAKAYAKQGIKEGKNIIRVGKKSITVELKKVDDFSFWDDTYGENHKIDCSYYATGDNSYSIAQLMNSAIDYDQLIIDYLLYSDNLIAEIKTQLRKLVMDLRNEIEYHTANRYTLNQLGLQDLIDGCDSFLNDYVEVA